MTQNLMKNKSKVKEQEKGNEQNYCTYKKFHELKILQIFTS